jgi:hypothetical protein
MTRQQARNNLQIYVRLRLPHLFDHSSAMHIEVVAERRKRDLGQIIPLTGRPARAAAPALRELPGLVPDYRQRAFSKRAEQPDRALVRQPRANVFWCWRSRIEKGGRNCLLGP